MDNLKFYIKKREFVTSIEDIDLSFIPPLQRRKLSKLNRAVFFLLNKCMDNSIERIVYSSRYGEFDKLHKLIEQQNQDGEVSPILFSSSVHNANVGNFLQLKQKSIPYDALSASGNSISMGLLSAISSNKNILFCYADYLEEEVLCVTLNIYKDKLPNYTKYRINFDNKQKTNNLEQEQLLLFAQNKTDCMYFDNYAIEKEENA